MGKERAKAKAKARSDPEACATKFLLFHKYNSTNPFSIFLIQYDPTAYGTEGEGVKEFVTIRPSLVVPGV